VGLSAKVGVDLIKLDQPIAFDAADQAKVKGMLARYPSDQRESAIMPALWLAQERFGFISQDAVDLVARSLDVDSSVVAGVATFYTMYHLEPVGRHVIQVCCTLSCSLMGAEALVKRFEQKLGIHAGETTKVTQVLKINQVVTGVPFGDGTVESYLDTSSGDVVMDLGSLEDADVTVTTDYETAKALFVEQDAAAGMQAFMAGKITVQGDMMKLMAMQTAMPTDEASQQISEEIKAITL